MCFPLFLSFLLLPILLHLLRLHYPHLFCLDNRSPLFVICKLKSSLGIRNLQAGQTNRSNSKHAAPLEFFRIPQYQIFHRSCFGMICSPPSLGILQLLEKHSRFTPKWNEIDISNDALEWRYIHFPAGPAFWVKKIHSSKIWMAFSSHIFDL